MDIPDVYPTSTDFPFESNDKNKTMRNESYHKDKDTGNVRDTLGPGPALHQQLNIVEIAVILVIGATTAIGKSKYSFYKILTFPLGFLKGQIPESLGSQS